MTPLNSILGNQASAILLLGVVGVALLSAAAAVLDFMGTGSGVLAPEWERLRTLLFVGVGLPAVFILFVTGGTLGALTSGIATTGTGTAMLLWVANAAFVVSAVICGLCSPFVRHWGLGLAAFAVGLGLVFPSLAIISALGFNEDGLLAGTGARIAFGVIVGIILLAVAVCAAGALSIIDYIAERMVLLLRARHHPRQFPPVSPPGEQRGAR